MTRQVLSAAKWTTALCGLILSPFALGALIFAGYFVIDGARALGPPADSAIFCVLLAATLLLRRRKTHPDG